MRLSGLLPLLDDSAAIRHLVDLAGLALPPGVVSDEGGPPTLAAPQVQAVVRESAKSIVVAALQSRAGRPLVVVAPDAVRAQAWVQDVQAWSEAPDRVLYLPGFDAGPWEQLPAIPDTVLALLRIDFGTGRGDQCFGPAAHGGVAYRLCTARGAGAPGCDRLDGSPGGAVDEQRLRARRLGGGTGIVQSAWRNPRPISTPR
ncbi:MAG: hypothetical protein EBS89_07840 [Proteobacteria bacterium]|nr:hypothetical protein [Pseudomonadota bacterium]